MAAQLKTVTRGIASGACEVDVTVVTAALVYAVTSHSLTSYLSSHTLPPDSQCEVSIPLEQGVAVDGIGSERDVAQTDQTEQRYWWEGEREACETGGGVTRK